MFLIRWGQPIKNCLLLLRLLRRFELLLSPFLFRPLSRFFIYSGLNESTRVLALIIWVRIFLLMVNDSEKSNILRNSTSKHPLLNIFSSWYSAYNLISLLHSLDTFYLPITFFDRDKITYSLYYFVRVIFFSSLRLFSNALRSIWQPFVL